MNRRQSHLDSGGVDSLERTPKCAVLSRRRRTTLGHPRDAQVRKIGLAEQAWVSDVEPTDLRGVACRGGSLAAAALRNALTAASQSRLFVGHLTDIVVSVDHYGYDGVRRNGARYWRADWERVVLPPGCAGNGHSPFCVTILVTVGNWSAVRSGMRSVASAGARWS